MLSKREWKQRRELDLNAAFRATIVFCHPFFLSLFAAQILPFLQNFHKSLRQRFVENYEKCDHFFPHQENSQYSQTKSRKISMLGLSRHNFVFIQNMLFMPSRSLRPIFIIVKCCLHTVNLSMKGSNFLS